MLDPLTHLVSYRVRNVPGTPRHLSRNVTIVNQLGTLALTTLRPELLLVPAAASLPGQPPPALGSHGVDHFKCYKVKVTAGTTPFPRNVVTTISDRFRGVAGTFAMKKPRQFCNPVDKNGEGISNPAAYLVCYAVKPVSGVPRHQRVSDVRTASSFGDLTVGTIKETEVCVPSATVIAP